MFTDHANIIYIFDPFGSNPGVSRHVDHNLVRWKINLSAYRYVIELVSGENNEWAYIISRWAAAPDKMKENPKMELVYAPVGTSSIEREWSASAD